MQQIRRSGTTLILLDDCKSRATTRTGNGNGIRNGNGVQGKHGKVGHAAAGPTVVLEDDVVVLDDKRPLQASASSSGTLQG